MKKKIFILGAVSAMLMVCSVVSTASTKTMIISGLMNESRSKVECAPEYSDSNERHVLLCNDCKTYAPGLGTRWSECRTK